MTEHLDTIQGLQEFTVNLLSDVESGALTIHEAIIAASQYTYLRDAIQSHADSLSEAELSGEADVTEAFITILTETLVSIRELSGFQTQMPDVPKDEQHIREAGVLREHAVHIARDRAKDDGGDTYKKRREAFIHDVVTRFSTTTPLSSDAVAKATEESLGTLFAPGASAETKRRFVTAFLNNLERDGISLSDSERQSAQQTMEGAFTKNEAFTETARETFKEEQELIRTITQSPDMERPDVFVDIVIHAPDGASKEETLLRAAKLAETAESVTYASEQEASGRLTFFTKDDTRGVSASLQKGADSLLSLMSGPARDRVLKEKMSGKLQTLLSDTQLLMDKLGEDFVKSAVFTHISQNLTKQLSDRSSSGNPRGVVDDVFSTVFRGPLYSGVLGRQLDARVEDRIIEYFELARASAASPKGKGFLPEHMLPWEVFRTRSAPRSGRLDPKGSSAQEGAYSPSFGGWPASRSGLWAIPAATAGAFGTLLGNAATSTLDGVTSFFFTSPRLSQQVHASRRAAAIPTPIGGDMPLLLSLAVVVFVVLFFIFPSFLNFPQTAHSSKTSALFTSLIKSDRSATNGNGWPVTCGCIINGPDQNTHSLNHLNAIDFNFDSCKPIKNVDLFAVGRGTVTEVSSAYGIGETCDYSGGSWDCHGKSTYGNFVKITLDEGEASGMVVLYGHMATIDVKKGQSVNKGDKIGTSDHNGVSQYEHLHFEVLGGVSANPKLDGSNPVLPEAGTNGLCVGS